MSRLHSSEAVRESKLSDFLMMRLKIAMEENKAEQTSKTVLKTRSLKERYKNKANSVYSIMVKELKI